MRRMILHSVCCASLLIAMVVQAEPIRPLGIPPAPFLPKNEKAAVVVFEPKVDGYSIVSGNKSVVVRDTGMIDLFLGGLTPVQTGINIKTKAGWWPSGRKPGKLAYDPKNHSFQFTAQFPLESNKEGKALVQGTYNQTVKLLSDGRVHIEASWEVPENYKKDILNVSYNLIWPGNELGTRIFVGSKEYRVSEGTEKSWWFLKLDQTQLLTFFPDRPSSSFILQPEIFKTLLASSRNNLKITIAPDAEKNRLSFTVDIRRGIVLPQSHHTYAGIDFMAVEALEMPDYKSSKNLIPNPSFEQGLRYLHLQPRESGVFFTSTDKWKPMFTIDETESRYGKASLKIHTLYPDVDIKSDARRRSPYAVMTPIPLSPGTYTFSCFVKGDHPGRQRLYIGGTSVVATAEWQRCVNTFTIADSTPWVNTIRSASDTGDGYIWIDGMQLEHGDKVSEFETKVAEGQLLTSTPDNFLRRGDKIDAKLKIISKAGAAGTVKVTVKDFFSETLFTGEFPFRCDRTGQTLVSLPFDGKFSRGIFMVKAMYVLNDGSRTYDFFRFSIMDFLENKHRLKRLFNDAATDLDGMPNFLDRLDRWKKIGIGARTFNKLLKKDVFDAYVLRGIEPIDYAMFERMSKKLPNGLTANYFRLYDPDFAPIRIEDYRMQDRHAPLTEDYLKRFQRAVAENARKASWVTTWKMTAEESGGARFDMNLTDYIRLLDSFTRGIRQGNPAARVLQGGPSNMGLSDGMKEVDELLTAVGNKVRFDVIGIHPYQESPEYPDLDENAGELLKILKKHGYDKTPLLWPEGMFYGPYTILNWGIQSARWTPPACWYYGPLSYDMGWNEKISAAKRARSWLVALKHQDRVESFCSESSLNNFDLDMYLTPFASQKIPNTLGRLLGDAYFKKDIRFVPYTKCYLFEDAQKRPVAVVWGYHRDLDNGTMPPFQVKIKGKSKNLEIFDLMEAERSVKPDADGNIRFAVSSFPLFFRGTSGKLNRFIEMFGSAALVSTTNNN